MIAALFVETSGVYFGLPNVDPWDQKRDARTYSGPHPVVAHPPCARWGRYWSGGPNKRQRRRLLGDDDGCFKSALESVRKFGGVIEHPEASHAWRVFGLNAPSWHGGWTQADSIGGFTCCVSQGNYGHMARKMTWLYVFGLPYHELPELRWGTPIGKVRIEDGYRSNAERRRRNNGMNERLSSNQRARTPLEFRDLLIGIAGKCSPERACPIYRDLFSFVELEGVA